MDCLICCESKNKFLTCRNCKFSACIWCYKKFILEGTCNHASCMECKELFSAQFLFESFPKTWMTEYKAYQRKFAIEREKSQLPLTIPWVMHLKELKKLPMQKDELYKKIKELKKHDHAKIYTNPNRKIFINEHTLTNRDINDLFVYNTINNPAKVTEKYPTILEFYIYIFAKHISHHLKENINIKNISDAKNYLRTLVVNEKVVEFCTDFIYIHNAIKSFVRLDHILAIINYKIHDWHFRWEPSFNSYYDICNTIKQMVNFVRSDILIEYFQSCKVCDNGHVFKFKGPSKRVKKIICITCGIIYCKKCDRAAHNNAPCNENNYKLFVENYKLQRDLYNKIEVINYRLQNKHINTLELESNDTNVIANEKTIKFLYRCTTNECIGFVINKRIDNSHEFHNICTLCETIHCKKCNEKEHDDECDEDIIATKSVLRADTKNCPSCFIPIFRISGCLQMFCVNCNTGFDWSTLKIIKNEKLHNPHFTEYMDKLRAKKITTTIAPLGEFISINAKVDTAVLLIKKEKAEKNRPDDINNAITYYIENNIIVEIKLHKYTAKLIGGDCVTNICENYLKYDINLQDANKKYVYTYEIIDAFIRLVRELNDSITQHHISFEETPNNLRIQLLMNKITEPEFETKIGYHVIKKEKQYALFEILNTYICVISDYLDQMTYANMQNTIKDMYKITHFTNKTIISLADKFSMKMNLIVPNQNYEFI
jgi:hypothetical protein